MAETKKCSRCGAELPPGAPGGHCPQCLLNFGLTSAEDPDEPDIEGSSTPSPKGLASENPGDRIGHYQLVRQIGEGGMGVVWLAEQQEPVRRQVALKIVKLGMDTKQVVARFEAERQALALMDHPNIAKVLEAGATDTGRPYFVMELAHGSKITDYCDQHQLTVPERLKLFIQVCQAVQHAHQKGIVHRDLKPSNILVVDQDGAPAPKVIDFGIAKATSGQPLTDKTLFTAFEQFLGTPAYMSPEQADLGRLDIDTRSDIYSLGVLLYELLAGHPPFSAAELKRAALNEVLQTIREKEPPRPSTRLTTLTAEELTAVAECRRSEPGKLPHLIRGDLDWIVMKALEKDRNRRYETASGFARDVERHLDSEPVSARPPGKLYRLVKLVRRNRAVVGGVLAIFIALVLGLALSLWSLRREQQARRLSDSALAMQAELRQKAEIQEELARAALLLKNGDNDEAEKLLDKIPPSVRMDDSNYRETRRTLGMQQALHGQWQHAAADFTDLIKVNGRDDQDTASSDAAVGAPILVESGDPIAYEALRQATVTRFSNTTDLAIMRRVYRACLLSPADRPLLEQLGRWYEPQIRALKDDASGFDDWTSLGLGIFDYRRGDYSGALQDCRRSLGYGNAAAGPLAQLLLAMSHYREHQTNEALFDLTYVRETIEQHSGDGSQNWTVARIFLREALGLMGNPPSSNSSMRTQTSAALKRIDDLRTAQQLDAAEVALNNLPPESIILEGKRAGDLIKIQGWRQFVNGSRRLAAVHWASEAFGLDGLGGLSEGRDLSHFYLSYGPLLIELGDTAAYEKLRLSALENFSDTRDPLKAEPVLLACLLNQGDDATLQRLAAVAEVVAHSKPQDDAWTPRTADSLALLAYRKGDYGQSVQLLQKSRNASCSCPTIDARTHVLNALVCCQLRQFDRAATELAMCRDPIQHGFDQGKVVIGIDDSGVWYDWWIDHFLLQEAEAKLGAASKTAKVTN